MIWSISDMPLVWETLAKRIVSIVTNNRENRLKKLKGFLLDRKHPQHIIDYSFAKIFQPKFQTENNDSITFIEPTIPNIILIWKFHSCLDKIKNNLKLRTCFQKKKVLLSTRPPPKLRKLLTTAKFERLCIPKQMNPVGFFLVWTASIIKMVILKNVYLFLSNPKTNCWLGTIDTFLVAPVKMFNMWCFIYIIFLQ